MVYICFLAARVCNGCNGLLTAKRLTFNGVTCNSNFYIYMYYTLIFILLLQVLQY